jgi:hypothetical protein
MIQYSQKTSLHRHHKRVDATRNFLVDFSGSLAAGEVIVGMGLSSVSVNPSEELTVVSIVQTAEDQNVNGKLVPVGQAVAGKVKDGLNGGTYTLTISAETDKNQVIFGRIILHVRDTVPEEDPTDLHYTLPPADMHYRVFAQDLPFRLADA